MHRQVEPQVDTREDKRSRIVWLEQRGFAPEGRRIQAKGTLFEADPLAPDDLRVEVERDHASGEERG